MGTVRLYLKYGHQFGIFFNARAIFDLTHQVFPSSYSTGYSHTNNAVPRRFRAGSSRLI